MRSTAVHNESQSRFRSIVAILAVIALSVWWIPGSAQASFPGRNGDLLVWAMQPDNEGSQPSFVAHMYELQLDGSATREFKAPNSNAWPALSPDRTTLAFVSNPGDQVWMGSVNDLDASRQVSFEDPLTDNSASQPVFAPDGKSIVYSVWVGNYPGANFEKLVRYWPKSAKQYTTNDFTSMWPAPDISPDGMLIAYAAGQESNSTIRLTRHLGAIGRKLPAPGPAFYPSFSPDGKRIAYLSPVNGSWQVFISRLDGSHRFQASHEIRPVDRVLFSPDGTSIAYETGTFENPELVVQDLRTGQRQTVDFPGTYANLNLSEWPRTTLFQVRSFKPRLSQLRIRVFGPGTIVIKSGRTVLGRRKVRRGGTHNVHIKKSTRRSIRARVIFHPKGALPGSKRIRLKR